MKGEKPMGDPHAGGVVPMRVFLARDMTEAQLAVAFLEDRGIPAKVESPLSHMTLSVIESVIDGAEGVAIVVPSDRSAVARAALEEFRRTTPRGGDDGEE
jgi:hypothetical protein